MSTNLTFLTGFTLAIQAVEESGVCDQSDAYFLKDSQEGPFPPHIPQVVPPFLYRNLSLHG